MQRARSSAFISNLTEIIAEVLSWFTLYKIAPLSNEKDDSDQYLIPLDTSNLYLTNLRRYTHAVSLDRCISSLRAECPWTVFMDSPARACQHFALHRAGKLFNLAMR
jgi:hypothetical protein